MADWVAVLDDSMSRVAWLRERLPEDRYDIVHAVRVNTFFSSIATQLDVRRRLQHPSVLPAMVILDHDLGIGSFEDIDGNNGLDAVERIVQMSFLLSECFLVWSTNAVRSHEMAVRLTTLRAGSIVRIPFERERLPAIEAMLRERLG